MKASLYFTGADLPDPDDDSDAEMAWRGFDGTHEPAEQSNHASDDEVDLWPGVVPMYPGEIEDYDAYFAPPVWFERTLTWHRCPACGDVVVDGRLCDTCDPLPF